MAITAVLVMRIKVWRWVMAELHVRWIESLADAGATMARTKPEIQR